ncbi:hypothetical protein BDK51DRAFT_37063 [Blyttiomyces helicus]|uniref:Uncharacterized protein n=1 Tax=Blyttiomyces helicus TaxID=388810 RepID=A0A4P9W3F3_9FUNG|nr:hypothetical protein BDK51DRAFT_37063 [Blyttiomyces helicus]|eukprot:RKO84656.1 hypothetical protein BDK51DRAFT_37063 [Blyttiomyces helicus]
MLALALPTWLQLAAWVALASPALATDPENPIASRGFNAAFAGCMTLVVIGSHTNGRKTTETMSFCFGLTEDLSSPKRRMFLKGLPRVFPLVQDALLPRAAPFADRILRQQTQPLLGGFMI